MSEIDLVFVAHESPMAPGVGISPVLSRLPRAMRLAGARVSVITPYHHRVIKSGLPLEQALPPLALSYGGALQRALALVEEPVFTVSHRFAAEIATRSGFAAFAGDEPYLDDDGTTWIFPSGRHDFGMKGYDVDASAADLCLHPSEKLKFLFFPNPGVQWLEGLAFLRTLAARHPGMVIVVPFRWLDGYWDMLRAGTFGIYASIYEPFGGISELLLNGVGAIARATGKLTEQIVPLKSATSFSEAVRRRVGPDCSAHPTGILYCSARVPLRSRSICMSQKCSRYAFSNF